MKSLSMQGGGQFFVFDPSPDNIKKIKNLGLSGLVITEAAVSDIDGFLDFYENADRSSSGTDSLFNMNTIGYETKLNVRKVEVVTLDAFCKKNNVKEISFLKMDIEGNEYNALLGAKEMLDAGAIRFIQFEFGHAARAARVLLKDIVDLLERYGYEIYVIKPNFIEKVTYDPFYENRYNMINFFAFKCHDQVVMADLIRE